jgi:hypothetical protein
MMRSAPRPVVYDEGMIPGAPAIGAYDQDLIRPAALRRIMALAWRLVCRSR